MSRARLVAVVLGAALAVLGAVAIMAVVALPKLARTVSTPPSGPSRTSDRQTVLPFGHLDLYAGNVGTSVAVDRNGAVYVPDTGNGRVLELSATAAEPTPLPFPGLDKPSGVAVDPAGAVYVIQGELTGSRLAKLSPGASAAVDLPTSRAKFGRLAVGADGVVCVVGLDSVERLDADRFETLPKPPGDFPQSVAVDAAGAIYVLVQTDRGYHIQKLAKGAAGYTDLTPGGLQPKSGIRMIALDSSDAIYFTGGSEVSKFDPGAGTTTKLPFSYVMSAFGIAVAADGTVYVTDGNKVLKLPPQ